MRNSMELDNKNSSFSRFTLFSAALRYFGRHILVLDVEVHIMALASPVGHGGGYPKQYDINKIDLIIYCEGRMEDKIRCGRGELTKV